MEKRKKATIDFECDARTLKALKRTAKLADVTMDQVVSVILAIYIVNERGFAASFKPVDKKKAKGSAKMSVPESKVKNIKGIKQVPVESLF